MYPHLPLHAIHTPRMQASLAAGVVLLVRGAALPSCSGASAAAPALSGVAAGILLSCLYSSCLACACLSLDFLFEVAVPAAAKATTRRVASQGAPSEASSDEEREEV